MKKLGAQYLISEEEIKYSSIPEDVLYDKVTWEIARKLADGIVQDMPKLHPTLRNNHYSYTHEIGVVTLDEYAQLIRMKRELVLYKQFAGHAYQDIIDRAISEEITAKLLGKG